MEANQANESIKTAITGKISWFWIFVIIITGAFTYMAAIQSRKNEIAAYKKKLKYFKLTYTTGFWGRRETWEQRDTPLTDDELEKLWNHE